MATAKMLSYKDLENLLIGLEGQSAKMVRMHTRTLPHLKKTSRKDSRTFPETFGCDSVIKLDMRVVLINASYERVVNRRRKEAGLSTDFKSEGTYGKMIGKCILQANNGSTQVRTYHIPSWRDNCRYVKPDGTEFTKEQIADIKANFFDKVSDSEGKQGLSKGKQFRPLNFKMESVRTFKLDGQEYIVAGA